MMRCPKCNKKVDAGCSDLNCTCHKGAEIGSQLIYYMMLFGKIRLSEKFGDFLWNALCKIDFIIKPWKRQYILVEIRECLYCGKKMHYFAWEDLLECQS